MQHSEPPGPFGIPFKLAESVREKLRDAPEMHDSEIAALAGVDAECVRRIRANVRDRKRRERKREREAQP